MSNKQKQDKSESISVDDYHQRSKHHLQKYARGPDGLDWDTQPNPFREFKGSPRFALPLPAKNLLVPFNDIYQQAVTPAIMDKNTLGAFFELSMALSAWKVYGSERWALRINPSSGNLHPTEAYLVFAGSNIIPAGVYHYLSYDHCLEQRCQLKAQADTLESLFADKHFLIGLSSIHWREAWKYGERAYRYCQLDVGHAIAALRYAASLLGWQLKLVDAPADSQIASLLGLDREDDFKGAEKETVDVLLQIITTDNSDVKYADIQALLETTNQGEWKGMANCLSPDNRIHWDVIKQISETCIKPETEVADKNVIPATAILSECESKLDAASIIRQRRSAQGFDGQTMLSISRFYRILDMLLARKQAPPFDSINSPPRIHLLVFVHRIEGLKPGLYIFPRSQSGEKLLREKLREEFDWSRPPICPETLPLYHLVSARSQNAARTVSCHQDIAADGAFSVSMLAEFDASIGSNMNAKPWQYKRLFWEAGMLGQVLYLEAEAIGMRGTGIGCYFDDAVHEILGINDSSIQVMYHFTVGTPVVDTRLISLPPYGHLSK